MTNEELLGPLTAEEMQELEIAYELATHAARIAKLRGLPDIHVGELFVAMVFGEDDEPTE
jgi:hypothetical protein